MRQYGERLDRLALQYASLRPERTSSLSGRPRTRLRQRADSFFSACSFA